jgi:putative flippase GtrA
MADEHRVREIVGFLASGGAAFAVQLVLFNAFVGPLGAIAANGVALTVATLVAFVANRLVFTHRRSSRRGRELLAFVVVNAVAIGLSELVIVAGVGVGVPHDRPALNALTVFGAGVGLVVRFVGYRRVVFPG